MAAPAPAVTPWYEMLQRLEDSSVAAAVREGRWTYPAVEAAHILSFVVLVGAAAMFDLRLLGFSKRLPVTSLAKHLLRWSQGSVLVVVPAGLLLFATDAVATWDNLAFRVKMILLALAAGNAILFHIWIFRSVKDWDTDLASPLAAKASAVASLVLWTGVIVCGRLIAYI